MPALLRTRQRTRAPLTLTAAAVLAAVVLAPATALACGGLFCAQVVGPQTGPAPVDQTAERILFEVDGGTITAYVQIQYTGSADEFAWVVPVPSDPEIAESSNSVFTSLDQATQLAVTLPTPETCPGATPPSFGSSDDDGLFDCGCELEEDSSAEGGVYYGDPQAEAKDPVTVHQRDFTTNYEFVVISATQAQDLVDWLLENRFNVSSNMVPVMQPYVDEGMHFLGVKLRDGRTATDIVPIAMTYLDGMPMIPIQLTAVAAQPHMGIQVFILADQPYLPANYAAIEPDTTEILFDSSGATNYFDWVARRAAEAEGRLFVTEFVGSTASAGLSSQFRTLSRFYTRLSPEHMTLDPVFTPAQDVNYNRPATLDLSARASLLCNDFRTPLVTVAEREPAACAFNYCGPGSECTVLDDGRSACACASGDLAQSVTGPDGNARVTCVPADNPYAITAQAGGVGTEFDPCKDFSYGDSGKCVVKGGFPMCLCSSQGLAVSSSGRASCVPRPPAETLVFYGPGAGLESQGSVAPLTEDSLAADTTQGSGATFLLLGLSLGGLAALRRRRRR